MAVWFVLTENDEVVRVGGVPWSSSRKDQAEFTAHVLGEGHRAVEWADAALAAKLPIPFFSQLDPRWSNEKLGYGSTTIGRYGCVITSVAMAASHAYQKLIYPNEVNEELKKHNAYVGPNKNLLVFDRVTDAFPYLEYETVVRCRSTPANIPQLLSAVEAGKYVIAELDYTPAGTMQPHWLLITGGDTNVLQAHDPMIKAERLRLIPPSYALNGWNPSRIVTGWVVYRRSEHAPSL